ncbi:MAG: geranylgeranyl reductase family protein [Syntrophomonadaceae bacterium]
MTKPVYDVVVVGAGPAGASAASAAAEAGVKVLLIDSKRKPGQPVQCAEYAPLAVKKYAPLTSEAVVQKIETLLTYIDDVPVASLSGPGYMLDRTIFDTSLVKQACNRGADFWINAKAVSKTGEGLKISRDGQASQEVVCKIIIGADGPRSTVGRWMNSSNTKYMVALQYRLPLRHYQTSTDVYFKPEYEGGYGWIFPKGEFANVGVGVNIIYKNRLPILLNEFINKRVKEGKLLSTIPADKTGGLIPVGGPVEVTRCDNMLLAGDAAGQTHPVTGGGIMNAIVAGKIAGETAARAITANSMDILDEYPNKWKAFLGRFLEKGTKQRLDMDRYWSYKSSIFESIIRRNWIGFN